MRFSTTRWDVAVERPFRRPNFKLSRCAVEVLESFYDALSPDYTPAMSDLSAKPAMTMGDIAIRISMFGGNGLVEIGAEKMTARFEGLHSKKDGEAVQNVVLLSEAALQKALPDIEYKGAAIRTSAWLACDGGTKAVESFLEKYAAPKANIKPKTFGAERIKIPIHAGVTNETEGWDVRVFMDLSDLPSTDLYVACNGTFTEDGKFVGLEARVNHLENIYRDMFKHYGLERAEDNTEA